MLPYLPNNYIHLTSLDCPTVATTVLHGVYVYVMVKTIQKGTYCSYQHILFVSRNITMISSFFQVIEINKDFTKHLTNMRSTVSHFRNFFIDLQFVQVI